MNQHLKFWIRKVKRNSLLKRAIVREQKPFIIIIIK